ncbi:acyltransferase [Marinobacter adhaerens]|uniref:acyltransferase n=1 Tax=Marinobacter adhaerens TaxID=1033846 RepID=UPI001E2ECB1A|nr:acyltransferase [Marinobacter adhaerens]
MAQDEAQTAMKNKKIKKRIVKGLFLAFSFPIYAIYVALTPLSKSESVFQGFSQLLSLVPGKVGIYIRASFYSLACPNTSDEISIGFLTILSHRNTTIGPSVYIGPQCNIGKCFIGQNTLIGSGVHILSGAQQHNFEDLSTPIQEQGGTYTKIAIGEDCWLGNQALIMANLEEKTVVAAGSVVTKPFEKGAIVAGNPARVISNRFNNKKEQFSKKFKEERSDT